jgi:hypothetical protein
MAMTLKISTARSVTSAAIDETRSLTKIIEDIRNGRWSLQISQIRTERDKSERDYLKKALPIMLPCIELHGSRKLSANDLASATGIIQFDLDSIPDGVSPAETRSKIRALDGLLYLFSSPSSEDLLKFGIRTDFCSVNPDEISDKFRIAYNVVSKSVEAAIGCELDGAMQSINQACYMSYDPAAFVDENAQIVPVMLDVTRRFAELETERNKWLEPSRENLDVDYDEIESALAAIPQDLGYDERFRINLSVIDQLGVGAIQLLLAHWNKTGADREKLKRNLKQQLKGHQEGKRGNRITIATLFREARSHGWNTAISRSVNPVVVDEPPTYDHEHISPTDAEKKVENSVRSFLNTGDDTALLVEAGLGKTELMVKSIVDLLSRDSSKNIAVFVPSHKLSKEIAERIRLAIRDWKSDLTSFQRLKYQKSFGVVSIEGRNRFCSHFLKMALEAENLQTTPADCLRCDERTVCNYVEQFNNPMARIRIYTHDAIFNEKSVWDSGSMTEGKSVIVRNRDWKPDYLVIDEDIIPKAVSDKPECFSVCSKTPTVVREVIGGMILEKSLNEILNGRFQELCAEFQRQNKLVTTWRSERRSLASITDVRKRVRLAKENDKNKPIYPELVEHLLKLATMKVGVNEMLIDETLWVEGAGLRWARKKKIHSRWSDIPMLLLDASGSLEVIEAALERKFETKKVRVKYQDNVYVKQIADSTLSKTWLNNQDNYKKLQKWLATQNGAAVITYKPHKALAQLTSGVLDHFGNIRGSNQFEKEDHLIVIGRHKLPSSALLEKTRAVFGYPRFVSADDHEPIGEETVKAFSIYRMKSGHHRKVPTWKYSDSRMRFVSEHFEKAETYQAAHRLRLLHGNHKKSLTLVTNEVLDITIDELITGVLGNTSKSRNFNLDQVTGAVRRDRCVKLKHADLASAAGIENAKLKNIGMKKVREELALHRDIKILKVDGRDRHRNRRQLELGVVAEMSEAEIRQICKSQYGFEVENTPSA